MTKSIIKNTGERMVPEFSRGTLEYGEHVVRYAGAAPIVKNKVVLDIASGSGYGTAMLAKTAKKVFGVDYNNEAIAYAKHMYGAKNITFLQGSATDIPLKDNSVDVVVSFETIEHIEDYQQFMKEIKRVLTKKGLLILSTPNDKEFPEGAHYHLHEFEQKELEQLVKKYFTSAKSYFQATWKYNALLTPEQLTKETTLTLPTMNVAPVELKKSLYFYMLCANRRIIEKVEPVAAMSEHWSTRKMLEHNAYMDKYMRDMRDHFEGIIAAKDTQVAESGGKKLIHNSRRAARWLKRKANRRSAKS